MEENQFFCLLLSATQIAGGGQTVIVNGKKKHASKRFIVLQCSG